MSAAGGHFELGQHLPAVIVVTPLIASGLVALLRNNRVAWFISLAVSWVLPVFAVMLLSKVMAGGTISYALGGWEPPLRHRVSRRYCQRGRADAGVLRRRQSSCPMPCDQLNPTSKPKSSPGSMPFISCACADCSAWLSLVTPSTFSCSWRYRRSPRMF